jgi:hypothetical protein
VYVCMCKSLFNTAHTHSVVGAELVQALAVDAVRRIQVRATAAQLLAVQIPRTARALPHTQA